MSGVIWHSDQRAAQREAATLSAELHTNTAINIGEVNDVSPDVFTRLVAVLERIERRLDAPRKPIPTVRALGFLAGGSVNQQLNLPPWAAWSLDTLVLAQRPGATGTFSVTVSGLFYSDFFLQSAPAGVQSVEVGVPLQQASMVTLTETGAGTTGGATLYLVCTPL